MLTATDSLVLGAKDDTKHSCPPTPRENCWGRGGSCELGGSRHADRRAALGSPAVLPLSRAAAKLPRPHHPQPAPPLAPVYGKSRLARGGRGSLPAGAVRGAVLPAEGPARAVSEKGPGSACGAAPRPSAAQSRAGLALGALGPTRRPGRETSPELRGESGFR